VLDNSWQPSCRHELPGDIMTRRYNCEFGPVESASAEVVNAHNKPRCGDLLQPRRLSDLRLCGRGYHTHWRVAASALVARSMAAARKAGDWPLNSPLFARPVTAATAPKIAGSVDTGRMIEHVGNLRSRKAQGSGMIRLVWKVSPPKGGLLRSGNFSPLPPCSIEAKWNAAVLAMAWRWSPGAKSARTGECLELALGQARHRLRKGKARVKIGIPVTGAIPRPIAGVDRELKEIGEAFSLGIGSGCRAPRPFAE
jgi:hypothetical protein